MERDEAPVGFDRAGGARAWSPRVNHCTGPPVSCRARTESTGRRVPRPWHLVPGDLRPVRALCQGERERRRQWLGLRAHDAGAALGHRRRTSTPGRWPARRARRLRLHERVPVRCGSPVGSRWAHHRIRGHPPVRGGVHRGPPTTGGHTPNGSLQFLQVVSITDDELVEMQETSTAQVLRRLTLHSPDLVTDPDR